MAVKNTDVHGGGISRHVVRPALRSARARGARFVLISPLKDDIAADLDAEWLPVIPGTDVALMLAIAFVLVSEGTTRSKFLDPYTTGYPRFEGLIF